jgi:ribosome-associated protein
MSSDGWQGRGLLPVHETHRPVDRDTVGRWAAVAAKAADDKQGTETVVLDVGSVLAITDFFVITSAPNTRLVRTIAEAVEERLRKAGGPTPLGVEGRADLQWVLLDYGDLVVHVFSEPTRRFYDIERLYRDVPVLPWRSLVADVPTDLG